MACLTLKFKYRGTADAPPHPRAGPDRRRDRRLPDVGALRAPEDRLPGPRRQALRAGAGALALSAVRPVSPAPAASGPRLFELRVPDGGAHAAGLWRTTPVLRAGHRFDLVGLGWSSGAVEAQVRARRAGG